MLASFLHFSVFLFGGLSSHSNFSTSAAICAMGERGGNRNRVTGQESYIMDVQSCTPASIILDKYSIFAKIDSYNRLSSKFYVCNKVAVAAKWSQHFGRRPAKVLRHPCRTYSKAEEIRGCVPKSGGNR